MNESNNNIYSNVIITISNKIRDLFDQKTRFMQEGWGTTLIDQSLEQHNKALKMVQMMENVPHIEVFKFLKYHENRVKGRAINNKSYNKNKKNE